MATSSELKSVGEGRILSMDVPATWLEWQEDRMEDAGYLREYLSPTNSDVKVCLYSRGRPLSDSTAAALRGILLKPSHALSKLEQESIEEVLGNAAIPEFCQLQYLRTTVLNERPVLFLEGLWQNGNRSLQLFISTDRDAKFVQEVWFMAPGVEFSICRPLFQSVMDSIKWIDS